MSPESHARCTWAFFAVCLCPIVVVSGPQWGEEGIQYLWRAGPRLSEAPQCLGFWIRAVCGGWRCCCCCCAWGFLRRQARHHHADCRPQGVRGGGAVGKCCIGREGGGSGGRSASGGDSAWRQAWRARREHGAHWDFARHALPGIRLAGKHSLACAPARPSSPTTLTHRLGPRPAAGAPPQPHSPGSPWSTARLIRSARSWETVPKLVAVWMACCTLSGVAPGLHPTWP